MEPSPELDALASHVYHAAREVRQHLGVGLYESVYERLLVARLRRGGHDVATHVPIRLSHGGEDLGIAGRIDVVVDDVLVLELKASGRPHPVHEAQLLTYLRLGGFPLGLIIDFHAVPFRAGVRRKVNAQALSTGVAGVRGDRGALRPDEDDNLNHLTAARAER